MKRDWLVPDIVAGLLLGLYCVGLWFKDRSLIVDGGLFDLGPFVIMAAYLGYKKMYARRNRFGTQLERPDSERLPKGGRPDSEERK